MSTSMIAFCLSNLRVNQLFRNNFSTPPIFQQISLFSKYISKSRTKRMPLNTKRAGKGYKKGYGGRKEGFLSRKGNFVHVKEMRTELIVPDLSNFKLKAYIAPGIKRHEIEITPESIVN